MNEGVSREAMFEAKTNAENRAREARQVAMQAQTEARATLKVASENQAYEIRRLEEKAEARFSLLRETRLGCESKLAREQHLHSKNMDRLASERQDFEEQQRIAEESQREWERRGAETQDNAVKTFAENEAKLNAVMSEANQRILNTQEQAAKYVDEAGALIAAKVKDSEERRRRREASCLDRAFEIEKAGDGVKLLSEVERRRAKIAQLVAEADAASTKTLANKMVRSCDMASSEAVLGARHFGRMVRRQADAAVGQRLCLASENIQQAKAECARLVEVDLRNELFAQDREIASVTEQQKAASFDSAQRVLALHEEGEDVLGQSQKNKLASDEELARRRQEAEDRIKNLQDRLDKAQDNCENGLRNVAELAKSSYQGTQRRIQEENQRWTEDFGPKVEQRIKDLEVACDKTVSRLQRETERKVQALDERANRLLETTQDAENTTKQDFLDRAGRAEARLLELRKTLPSAKQDEADQQIQEMETWAEEECGKLLELGEAKLEEERQNAKALDQESARLGLEFQRADRRLREVFQKLRGNGHPDIAEELRWLCWNPNKRAERFPLGLAGYTFAGHEAEERQQSGTGEEEAEPEVNEWTGERRTRSGWGELRVVS